MTKELYKVHRPKNFDQMIGQHKALEVIKKKLKKGTLPHTILFTGPTGVGKTTIARILRRKLKCNEIDYKEMNCADDRGIAMARELSNNVGVSPLAKDSECRIWVLDEFHQTTTTAQEALLKTLEDTPETAYIFLLTSQPNKVIAAIQSRATIIKLEGLHPAEIDQLVLEIARRENVKLKESVRQKIIEVAEGSARRALNLLDKVMEFDDAKDQIDAVQKSDPQKMGIDLARLLYKRGGTWKEVVALLENMKDDPENVRRVVLGYGASSLLKGWGDLKRTMYVMNCFRDPTYDIGFPGIVLACAESYHG